MTFFYATAIGMAGDSMLTLNRGCLKHRAYGALRIVIRTLCTKSFSFFPSDRKKRSGNCIFTILPLKQNCMSVTRFGISIELDLLEALDEYVQENHFSNRSQAIRHLISRNIIEHKWQCNNQVAGSITLFYDPRKRDLLSQIVGVLDDFSGEVLSAQRFLLEKNKCLEIIAVKGIAKRLTALSDALVTVKGIHHCKLTMSRAE